MVNFEAVLQLKSVLKQIEDRELDQDLFEAVVVPMEMKEILLSLIQIHYTEHLFQMETIIEFMNKYEEMTGIKMSAIYVSLDDEHPLNVFSRENEHFLNLIDTIEQALLKYKSESTALNISDEMKQLGHLYRHYNRKEKLYFPILERHQVYTMNRKLWEQDDDIKALYSTLKKRLLKLDEIEFRHIEKCFNELKSLFISMMQQETYLLIPLVQALFAEQDYINIDHESDAFGFAIKKGIWQTELKYVKNIESLDDSVNLRMGGGFLTVKEANLILNQLPLELTFIDKRGLFKYFNEITEAKDMMFIRTPLSIGRAVANCHPPKSLPKMMQVLRNLKERKSEKEVMWFKKGNEYIYVTYTAVFDEHDEYMGILEYVQDIQPFFELPAQVKRDVTKY